MARTGFAGAAVALFGVLLVVSGCGGGGDVVEVDEGAGGATASDAATSGGGSTYVPSDPEVYSGPALETGTWVDVTGTLSAVGTIWAVPKRDRILASVPAKGLWAYTAAGNAWTQLKGTASLEVVGVTFDPRSGDRFWMAATGASGGVMYTEDAGQTVKRLGSLTDVSGIGVDIKTTFGQVIVAAKALAWPFPDNKGAVFVSKDGGTTWDDKTAAFTAANATPFGYAYAIDDQNLLASVQDNGTTNGGNGQGGIFFSHDGGASWAKGAWGDSVYCKTKSFGCGYSGQNQPGIWEAFEDVRGYVYWFNWWHSTYFRTTDKGSTLTDENLNVHHGIISGGGHFIDMPRKYTLTGGATDPNLVAIQADSRCAADPTCVDKQKIVAMTIDSTKAEWWAPFLSNPVAPASVDTKDQLAYSAVANALYLSNQKGSGANKLVWRYVFAP